MREYSTGELLFCLVCLVVLSSVESFNWTAQPNNPTPAIKGQDVSLAWQYSLTAGELLQSQTQFIIHWKKLNQSTSNYDKIGTKSYFQVVGGITYLEPQKPRVVIDRSDQATLHIKDVRREDEGTYRIEFTLKTDGSFLAEQRVNVTVLEPPELDYASNDQDVCEDSMVTLYCNATGKPAPNINWTRVWENDTDSEQLPVVDGSYVMSNIKRSSSGTYRCTAYNGVGDPVNHTVKVIVGYSAAVVRVVKSSNVVIEGDDFSLTCKESGYPTPNVTWISVSNDEYSYGNILNFTNITRGDSGDYTCETKNRCGKESRNESINVFYPPDIVNISDNQIVNETDMVNLTCEADANPRASITWTRLSDNRPVSFPLTITGKQDEGGYRCTAENGIQDPARKTVNITVEYHRPIETTLGTHVKSVILNKTFNITCRAQANPAAQYRFYKNQDNVLNDTSGSEVAVIETSVHERVLEVNYSCTPFNKFGDGPTEVTSVSVLFPPFVIDGNHTELVSQENCPVSIPCPIHGNPAPNITWYNGSDSSTIISKASTLELSGTVCNHGGLYTYTCFAKSHLGSVTVTLKVLVETPEPTTPSTPTSKESACSGFFQKEDCNINLVVVIVIAVAGLIFICIIVGIIAWWVHKRRKCRKDTRVHHSTSEERPFSRENSTPGDDNSYSKVNNGYAEAGPQSSEMASLAKHQEASGPATVPDYAVVDKSAKKGKKKDKKVEEQKLAAEPPQYAAVDKSKKKKKGEPDATYAQVDMSKKSKKKPKPGEVLYADLGDFQQMQELPAVSTSPQALPPIKKPAPYGETQYADITQFLKGDATLPESKNSQGPDTGTQAAPAPGNNNSQEPGTSTKETSQASNPGGGGGPGHETNF